MNIVIDNALLPALSADAGAEHPANKAARALAQAQRMSLKALQLPHLRALIKGFNDTMGPTLLRQDDWAWSTPAEGAVAQALGLPGQTGCWPWAAWETGLRDRACAWVTPCHWRVGVDRLTLLDPAEVHLSETESRAFMELIAPWVASEGLSLSYHSPERWLAEGSVLADLPCASLSCAVGRSLDPWLPSTGNPVGAKLRRLQNEMQMLLYTHALNDERQAQGQLPVNAFWLHGAGVLPLGFEAKAPVLRLPALNAFDAQHQTSDWAEGWQRVDSELGELLRPGLQVQSLSLCGAAQTQVWQSLKFKPQHKPSIWSGLKQQLKQGWTSMRPLPTSRLLMEVDA
jgi:hypothetical protein